MKALIAIAAVVLVGCGSIANTAFDNEEVLRYVTVMIRSERLLRSCGTPASVKAGIPDLRNSAEDAAEYSRVKFNDPRYAEAGKILLEQIDQLNTRYTASTPSNGYCELKLGMIFAAAEKVARSISGKELPSPVAVH
jgi:hypothetical protein